MKLVIFSSKYLHRRNRNYLDFYTSTIYSSFVDISRQCYLIKDKFSTLASFIVFGNFLGFIDYFNF